MPILAEVLGGVGDVGPSFDLSNVDTFDITLDSVFEKLKEIWDLFKQGFDIGFDNTSFDAILGHLDNIKNSLIDIWTDPEVLGAVSNYVKSSIFNLGKIVGSIASIGVTIAENLLGGIDLYFSQHKDDIKNWLVTMFDVGTEINNIVGNFAVAIADIFTVFRSDEAKQITADLINIFSSSVMGVLEICSKLGRDILNVITKPIIENKDLIKNAISNLLGPLQTITSTISAGISETWAKISEVYDAHVKPMFDAFANGLSSIVNTLLTAYNTYIAPVLDNLATKFREVWEAHIQPVVNKIIEFFGKICDVISMLWQNFFVPFINWIIATLVPVLAPIFETVGNVIMDVFGVVCDVVGGIIDFFTGLIDFVVGVFSGDWETAWNGIKEMFSGIWNAIKGIVEGIWNAICSIVSGAIEIVKSVISAVLSAIEAIWSTIWNTIKNVVTAIWDGIKSFITTVINAIKTTISTVFEAIKNTINTILTTIQTIFTNIWNGISTFITNTINAIHTTITNVLNAIKTTWDNILNAIKTLVTNIWNAIKTTITNVINNVKTTISNVLNGIKSVWENIWNGIKSFATNIWNGISSIISNVINTIKNTISNVLNAIKTVWDNVFNGLKNTATNIFNGIWNAIKGVINSILGGIEKMANGVINGLNGMIRAMNSLSFDVPDWVPGIGGKKFGFNIPTLGTVSLPRLAKGGIVNQPTQAIIGEAGKEAVLPLENNTEWMDTMSDKIATKIANLLAEILGNQTFEFNFNSTLAELIRVLQPELAQENTRRGAKLIVNAK